MQQAPAPASVERGIPPSSVNVRAWVGGDWLALAGVMLAGGLLRFVRIGRPSFMIFDEKYYALDACRYVTEGRFLCGVGEATYAHPPVGKWLIASGIWAFGPTAFGSRLMVATFGVLSVGVLFLLARLLLGSTVAATIGAVLLAIDPLHLVTSRTAILEVFASFFVLVALLFYVLDRRRRGTQSAGPPPPERVVSTSRDLRWSSVRFPFRVFSGAAMGLAIGSKWTVAPVLLGLAAWALHDACTRCIDKKRPLLAAIRGDGVGIALAFGIVPLLIYVVTYLGRLEGSFSVLPWDAGSWVMALVGRHLDMVEYHLELRRVFVEDLRPAYESSPWTWPLLRRPIPFSFAIRGDVYREVLALGNPLVWWPALIGSVFVMARPGRRQGSGLRGVVLVGLGGTYLIWLPLSPFVSNTFIYYFVSAVPFLCLVIAAAATKLLEGKWARATLAVYLGLVALVFLFFYPVMTWRPLSEGDWRARMTLSDCTPRPLDDKRLVAGYRFKLGNPAVEAYEQSLALRRGPLPLHTQNEGWCWM